MSGVELMNPKAEKHLIHIKNRMLHLVDQRYRAGNAEYQTDLTEHPKLTDEAISEAIDILVYLLTKEDQEDYDHVNRFEVIDHTETGEGRAFTKWQDTSLDIKFSLQDDGRTLKIFLKEKTR